MEFQFINMINEMFVKGCKQADKYGLSRVWSIAKQGDNALGSFCPCVTRHHFFVPTCLALRSRSKVKVKIKGGDQRWRSKSGIKIKGPDQIYEA